MSVSEPQKENVIEVEKQIENSQNTLKSEEEQQESEADENFTGWDKIKIDEDWKKEVKPKKGGKGKKTVI